MAAATRGLGRVLQVDPSAETEAAVAAITPLPSKVRHFVCNAKTAWFLAEWLQIEVRFGIYMLELT